MNHDIFSIEINDIEGRPLNLSQFKGKKLLIVNVASECGYTPQYALLQDLHKHFSDKIAILACPCNDFGAQEPGTPEEIAEFCRREFSVSFALTEKVKILGDDAHPLYQWLTQADRNGIADSDVKWNFQKYLVNEDGSYAEMLPSSVSPLDTRILSWIGVEV